MKWGYPLAEIGDLVSSVKKWNPRQNKTNELFNYIDIASVNRETKEVEDVMKVLTHEAPSRARQLVMDGDVLVSTVRPNLNAVAHLKKELSGATASTGFTVLRPDSKKVCDRYLYYWVRSPYFVQDMIRRSTGASYPAVSDSIIKAYNIPLPTLIRIQTKQAIESDYLAFIFNHSSGKKLLKNKIKTSAGQYTVSQKGIESIKMPIPPHDLQVKYAQHSQILKNQRDKYLLLLENSDNLFNSLLQKAFRGEL